MSALLLKSVTFSEYVYIYLDHIYVFTHCIFQKKNFCSKKIWFQCAYNHSIYPILKNILNSQHPCMQKNFTTHIKYTHFSLKNYLTTQVLIHPASTSNQYHLILPFLAAKNCNSIKRDPQYSQYRTNMNRRTKYCLRPYTLKKI